MTAHEPDECAAVQAAMALLGRAWAGAVLWSVLEGRERFGEIRERVPGVSDAVLSARLKDLAEHGLVERLVEPGPPVRVRYVATPVGHDARGVLEALRDFTRRHPEVFGPAAG